MSAVSFDDLPDVKSGGVSFDDLPDDPQAPFNAAKAYMGTSPGIPADISALPPDQQFPAYFAKTKAYHEVAPGKVYAGEALDAVENLPRTVGQIKDAAGNVISSAGEGAVKAGGEYFNPTPTGNAVMDAARRIPFLQNLMVAPAVIGGLAAGAEGFADTMGKFQSSSYIPNLAKEATAYYEGGNDAAARARARADFENRKSTDARNAVVEKVKDATGNPGIFSAAEQAAPFILPGGASLEGAGAATKVGSLVEGGINKAVPFVLGRGAQAIGRSGATAAEHAGAFGGALGLGSSILHGASPLAAVGELATGAALQASKPLLIKLGNAGQALAEDGAGPITKSVSRAVGQITGAGINTLAATGTGLLYGVAGAPAGQEDAGAIQGAAMGLPFAPLAVWHGGFARQGAEQAAKNATFRELGAPDYSDPSVDAPHAAAIKTLPQVDQDELNTARGFYRNVPGKDGSPVRIVVHSNPDFLSSLAGVSKDALPAGAQTGAGYFNEANNTAYINADLAKGKMGVTISQALGHEGTHALYSALGNLNPEMLSSLNQSTHDSSLVNGQPTDSFRAFMQSYNGGNPVDWDALPPDAPNGQPSKAYYLREVGAQTGLAVDALKNPGKFALPPEASDVVLNAIGDWARKIGLKQAPDITQALPGQVPSKPIPADPVLFAKTRDAFRAVGEADRTAPAPVEPIAIPPKTTPIVRPVAAAPASAPERIPPAPTGVAIDRNTPAYQNALSVLTLAPKFGGQGMSRTDAMAKLDAAAMHPEVKNTVSDYMFFALQGRPRDERAASESPTPVQTAQPAAQTPNSASVPLPYSGAVPPTAVAPGTEPASGAPVPPTSEVPAGTTPPIAGTPVPTSPPGQTKSEVSTASPKTPTSGQLQGVPSIEATSATGTGQPAQTGETVQPEGGRNTTAVAEPEKSAAPSVQATPAVNAPQPSGLSADDIAKIEAEAEKNFAYTGPKPSKKTLAENPNALEERTEKALAESKRNAVIDAHKATVPAGDNRVQLKVDPLTGDRKFTGKRFVAGDALHDSILSSLDGASQQHLSEIQDAIAIGKPVNMDYASAPKGRTQQTAQERREAQAKSTAGDRASGESLAQEADKLFYPFAVGVTKDDHVTTFGFSPDKLLGNGKKLLDYFINSGRELPYNDVNDPRFIADVAGYNRNHANGVNGQGTRQLVPTEHIGVPETPDGYEPYVMTRDRADFMNALMGNESAQSKSATAVKAQALRDFAKANGITPDEAGEVNSLRAEINAAGDLQSGPDVGTKAVLETPFETLRVDNIIGTKPASNAPPESTNLRAQAFRGDRQQLTKEGFPSANFAGSGFLPSRVKAGETIPGTSAKAAEDLPVREYGNATVTGAGLQFMPAYHGTPHDVDRFSSEKIGTGEGAQVYGFGLYFAESPKVAEEYQKNLSGLYNTDAKSRDGKKMPLWVANSIKNGKIAEVKSDFEGRLVKAIETKNETHEQGAREVLDSIKSYEAGTTFHTGALYTVDLDVHPDHLLDWDRPLSEQSEYVKDALRKAYGSRSESASSFDHVSTHDLPGMFLYDRLAGKTSDYSPRAASEALNKAGILGIKYLDEGSRKFLVDYGNGRTAEFQTLENAHREVDQARAKGFDAKLDESGKTHNFVMFDESKIRITHKNGEPVGPAKASFLPASSAGASPEEVDNAEKLWKEKGVESPYFRQWSKDSRVVMNPSTHDFREGDPVVIKAFHGAPDVHPLFKEGFKKFSRGDVYFATDSERVANTYADPKRAFDYQNADEGAIPLFVRMENPKVIDGKGKPWRGTQAAVQQAKDAGHDGIVIKNSIDDYQTGKSTKPSIVFAFFNPTQAKSAVVGNMISRLDRKPMADASANRGTFDPSDPRINFLPGNSTNRVTLPAVHSAIKSTFALPITGPIQNERKRPLLLRP